MSLIGCYSVLNFSAKVSTKQRHKTDLCRATSSVWNFFLPQNSMAEKLEPTFKKGENLSNAGACWVMGWFGGARAFVFNFVCPKRFHNWPRAYTIGPCLQSFWKWAFQELTFDLSIFSLLSFWESSLKAITPVLDAFSFQPVYVMVLLAQSWSNDVWVSEHKKKKHRQTCVAALGAKQNLYC